MEINVNRQILVSLTDHGEDVLRKHYEAFMSKPAAQAILVLNRKEAKYKFTLWEFMKIFGKEYYMGTYKIPTVNNVIELLEE